MSKVLLKSLPFDISARLPLQLGRESIASSTAAITELIKNSYDANAENVRVSFINRSSPIARLQIEDDGDGMDLETLEKIWLRIGTEHKSDIQQSEKKQRVYTGAKGLGRLGIDRLCRKAILQTKTEEMDHILEVHVNWDRYAEKNATISGITHRIFKVAIKESNSEDNFFRNKKKGTRLVLSGLKETWKDSRIGELKNELSLLVSPFSTMNDFMIELKSGLPEIDGMLNSEKFLDAAVWSITAAISEDNKVSATYTHPKTSEVHSLPPTDWKDWMPQRDESPNCGPVEMKVFYVPQPDSEVSTKKDWSTFMAQQHGIRIYKDEFRVRPYGEPSGRGDWLDLGIRKASSPGGIRQGGWRVGPRQLLGAIFISRKRNPNLIDQANREGMVETQGFFDLRSFALKIVAEFEALATDHARRHNPPDPLEEVTKALDDSILKSQNAVDGLTAAVSRDADKDENDIKVRLEEMQVLFEQTRIASEKQKEAYSIKKEELEREKDTLANLASLGILTVCFGHEAKEFCNLAATAAVELKETFNEGKFMIAPHLEEDFLNDLNTIIDSTKFIKSFASFSLGNVNKEKRKKAPVNISIVAKRVNGALEEALSRQNIRFDMSELSDQINVENSYEIDWESILVNMISNSIWAMQKTPKEKRLIKISGRKIPGAVEIRFKDAGCGLEKGTEKYIFNPMYSTRRDDRGNTVGTGMGLSITQTFISDHSGGHIKASATSDIGGAEFVITIPAKEE